MMGDKYRRAVEIDNDKILAALRQMTDWIWEFQDNLRVNKTEMYSMPSEEQRLGELLELINEAREDRFDELGIRSS